MKQVYTTAPVAYDGFGTKAVREVGTWKSTNGKHTKPVRLVEIADEHTAWQTMRYQSGLHPAWSEEQYQEEKKYGYIVD